MWEHFLGGASRGKRALEMVLELKDCISPSSREVFCDSEEIFYDSEEIWSHPLSDLGEKGLPIQEVFYDSNEVLTHSNEENQKESPLRQKGREEKHHTLSSNHRKKEQGFLEESHIKRMSTFMGPAIHIYIGPKDGQKIRQLLLEDPQGQTCNQIVEEISDAFIKAGVQRKHIELAASISGYASRIEYGRALLKLALVDQFDQGKNKDGSLDLHQPELLLVAPVKKMKIGNSWVLLPRKDASIHEKTQSAERLLL
jgi:hypothetical protein